MIVINQPIIALDFATSTQVDEFLSNFPTTEPLFVKIGMELFYATGALWIKQLQARNCQIFLDLKCYDIPHTVYRAMRVLGQLGVQLTTIHAAGGATMIQAAKKGLVEGATLANKPTPKLLAITQLTSMSTEQIHQDQLIDPAVSLPECVQAYAKLAAANGADGVVCSAHEAKLLHQTLPPDFLKITPGIRLANNSNDDQKRVMTPQAARANHSSGIVVGRAITQAANPLAAYRQVQSQWQQG